jgi:cobalt transport protein
MKQSLAISLLVALLAFTFSGLAQGGADEQATEAVQALRKDYQPWREASAMPGPEALWFAIQAGLGAGVLSYALSCLRKKAA